ncbi:glycosyltransferase [Cellulosimicrobium marinum]|uniref:glycosyltransferase n=1 Tax=Cellulosimicrobium marinum TaxID=1638992 RepID=UPI001E435FAD|nr:glycosyltransferase [Cellulosimicrobium marinum]MCB7137184.1 glycosyltransferase [Cellulosimicrobium marinum]
MPDLQRLALPRPGSPEGRLPAYLRGGMPVDGVVRVSAGGVLDLGTWLNAAPVGWWRELLGISTVRLEVRGSGRLTVRGGRGARAVVIAEASFEGGHVVVVPTHGVDWAWIEVEAPDRGDGLVDTVTWSTEGGEPSSPATVVVPTFRREADCRDQLARLTAPEAVGTVGRVVVVDQGGTLAASDGAREVIEAAGDRVVLLEQANLGGSGGYGRGMVESLRWPDDPVLLLDDDAEIDLEVLRRLLVVSELAPAPTVLGTGLLSAEHPTRLEALSEGVAPRSFRWGPLDGLGDAGADLADGGPPSWTFTHPRDRAQYTGWWGTLLPAGAVARVGLPAPYFLKWDDAEWGLRAQRRGLSSATLPGTAVWHPTWAAKGTISSWSAWPLHRNRLATAAAYGAGRGVLVDSLLHQVKHVLALRYDTAELWNAALGEVVGGPGWLGGDLTTVRPRAQAVLDARPAAPRVSGAPAATGSLPLPRALFRSATGVVRRARVRGTAGSVLVDDLAVLTWRTTLGRDLVELPGGGRLVRDPRRARSLLRATWRLHRSAWSRWSVLRAAYADALPEASSRPAWAARFGGRQDVSPE